MCADNKISSFAKVDYLGFDWMCSKCFAFEMKQLRLNLNRKEKLYKLVLVWSVFEPILFLAKKNRFCSELLWYRWNENHFCVRKILQVVRKKVHVPHAQVCVFACLNSCTLYCDNHCASQLCRAPRWISKELAHWILNIHILKTTMIFLHMN